jgi:HD-GYP domain-containing protein (c-di-GMP phosphodiesterase class II)
LKTKVLIQDLKPGMFVYELDRPWLDTPYLFQGFPILDQEDIDQLAQYCQYVFVDELRDHSQFRPPQRPGASSLEAASASTAKRSAFHGTTNYPDVRPAGMEMPAARQAQETATQILFSVRAAMEQGLKLDVELVKRAVDGLRDSIIRNPDALLFLAQLRNTKTAEYDRAINVAVYLLAFGRHLGLSRQELSELGLGGLLLDIGKLQLPPELLDKTSMYTATEHSLFKRHVSFGESMLKSATGISDKVIDMLAQHHEREDGSGYPRGLPAKQLGTFGRMAAIVDCFEELVIERSYARPLPPHEALQLIQSWGGRFFQRALVEHFIQCTGVYPVGSLVEMRSGEIGIVVSQNRNNWLQPKVLLVLNHKKVRFESPTLIDLLKSRNYYGVEYEIDRTLEAGMYGIDPRDFYA